MPAKTLPGIPPASPTPEQIRELRLRAGLERREAAALVHAQKRTWEVWEAAAHSAAHRNMPASTWELFAIKVQSKGTPLPDYLAEYFSRNE